MRMRYDPAAASSRRSYILDALVCGTILIGCSTSVDDHYAAAEREKSNAAFALLKERGAWLTTATWEWSTDADSVETIGLARPEIVDDALLRAVLEMKRVRIFSVTPPAFQQSFVDRSSADSNFSGEGWRGFEFTDDKLRQLLELPDLEELALEDSAITDAALAGIAARPKVKFVGVGGTVVSDEAISALRTRRPDCRVYRLPRNVSYNRASGYYETPVTPAALTAAADVPFVKTIITNRSGSSWMESVQTDVRNEDLRVVARIVDLEYLDLQGAINVTDDGLVFLTNLPKIRVINLVGTGVTPDGVAAMIAAYQRAGREIKVSQGDPQP